MRPLSRWVVAPLLWATALASVAAADRVLLLTLPEASASVAAVRRALQERAARGAPPLLLEVREVAAVDPLQPVDGRLPELPMAGPYRLIFATSMSLARAAQLRDPVTPIVFEGSADAVLMCLVDSLSRPGRNATGYTSALPDGPKMLDTLVDGFPALREVVMLVSGGNLHPADCGAGVPATALPPPCRPGERAPDAFIERLLQTAPVRQQARLRGVALRFLLLCDAADLALINRLAGPGVGFIVPYHFLFFANARSIIDRLAATRRPAVYGAAVFGPLGGLISVDTIADEVDDRASVELALKVLDGRSPAGLPVLMPRGFQVTVNAWAAAAQGLHPSLALLRRADRVLVQPPPHR